MKKLMQKPLASTLMSSVQAAYNHYNDKPLSEAMLYGLSGHAFVIHITNGLGPCAPYTWDMKPFDTLCKENLGLSIFNDETLITKDTTCEPCRKATLMMMKSIDEGNLVLLSSYEYQLITEYTDEVFITTKPWDDNAYVTPDLELNTFEGLIDFCMFYRIEKTEKISLRQGILDSLDYAISLFENPHATLDSAMGIKAYDFWLEKINEENATGHGNWWSSTVWAESRKMASLYMTEIKPYFTCDDIFDEVSEIYKTSSKLFTDIANRETKMDKKIELIKALKENEMLSYDVLNKLQKQIK